MLTHKGMANKMRLNQIQRGAMATTILDESILPVLTRYIDRYHWSFSIAMRLINRYYGAQYTQKELRALYRKNQNVS